MSQINYNPVKSEPNVFISEDTDGIEVLDARQYRPIGRFKFYYYIVQLLLLCLLIGVLINVWTRPYAFFLWNPTFASLSLYFYIQGILQVQWTESSTRRLKRARIHSVCNGLGTICIIIAFSIVEANKNNLGATHFTSPHGQLGLSIFVLVWIAAFLGITSLYIPGVFGGRAKAKKAYAPHRIIGYWIAIFMLINVILGIFTAWGMSNFKLPWVFVACVSVLLISFILSIDIRKVKF